MTTTLINRLNCYLSFLHDIVLHNAYLFAKLWILHYYKHIVFVFSLLYSTYIVFFYLFKHF